MCRDIDIYCVAYSGRLECYINVDRRKRYEKQGKRDINENMSAERRCMNVDVMDVRSSMQLVVVVDLILHVLLNT